MFKRKMWLVTHGAYNDRFPVGVFTTKELAEGFVASADAGVKSKPGSIEHSLETHSIEEVDVDPTLVD